MKSGDTVQTHLKNGRKRRNFSKHLEPGSYCFVETNAPVLSIKSAKWPFTIKENQQKQRLSPL
ncbi:hypothetical protein ACEQPO_06255 [Bacillus sp. SL00103]